MDESKFKNKTAFTEEYGDLQVRGREAGVRASRDRASTQKRGRERGGRIGDEGEPSPPSFSFGGIVFIVYILVRFLVGVFVVVVVVVVLTVTHCNLMCFCLFAASGGRVEAPAEHQAVPAEAHEGRR